MGFVGELVLGEGHHLVLECEHGAGIDLKSEMELHGSAAGLLGVQIHLPCLAHGVGLDEVPLVMDVESMIRSVVLQFGNESGHIKQCHALKSASFSPDGLASR